LTTNFSDVTMNLHTRPPVTLPSKRPSPNKLDYSIKNTKQQTGKAEV